MRDDSSASASAAVGDIDSCTTSSLTNKRPQAFEADLHKHVHLENNILFSRAGDRFVPIA